MNDINHKLQPSMELQPCSKKVERSSKGSITSDGNIAEAAVVMSTKYSYPFSMESTPPAVPMFVDSNEGSLSAVAQSSSQDPHDLAYEQLFQIDPQLLDGNSDLFDLFGYDNFNYPIRTSSNSYSHTPDWGFLQREQESISAVSTTSIHCPSLASGSTISSRNSSTRSTRSYRWHGSERLWEADEQDANTSIQPRPSRKYERDFPNNDSNMLSHQNERPEKCPIETCQYHVKGFARAFDRVRHTNTHFKGTLVCGFCPGVGSAAEKIFSRQDVFSRHLMSVHGVEQVSPTRRKELYGTGTIKESRKPSTGKPIAACTLCSESFDAQGFYEHLPGCTLREVTRDSKESSEKKLENFLDTIESKGSPRNDSVVTPEEPIDSVPPAMLPISTTERQISCQEAYVPESMVILPSNHKPRNDNSQEPGHIITESREIEELTASSRCLSLTSSNGIKSSDEETDWTEDAASPESETEAVRVQPMLSPMKRQLIDEIMKEFHHLFDQQLSNLRTCHGGGSSGSSHNFVDNSSNGSSSGDSPFMSRKRSLSGGGSRPPNDDRNNGDDPHKRRRPESKSHSKDSNSELRFACPYYKRNPGRHQTFTSCRDPGFITVARLKEHLYRRHLLPIQCNRCCSTFTNEPTLREHQRDPRGCEIQEQIPLEGFDKDQERKLKSKKRSLVYLSEEDKWKAVYRILFPDDNDIEMPTPYIEYQACNSSQSGQSSNIAHFQEFSRLELPRLVRRTLEVVVEQEAQPLEEKLKERLVDIVKECQTQLISMFQGIGGTINGVDASSLLPAPELPQERSDTPVDLSFQGFDSFHELTPAPEATPLLVPKTEHDLSMASIEKPLHGDRNSGSPDSGYDSTWTAVAFPQDIPFEAPLHDGAGYVDFGGYYGFEDRSANLDAALDPSMWSFVDQPFIENEIPQGPQSLA